MTWIIVHIKKKVAGTYDPEAGYSFQCDKQGNITFTCPEAEENYNFCKEHPELFTEDSGRLQTNVNIYTEPAVGLCTCGNHVQLVNQYQGACSCSQCGRWYNIFGQALIDPEYWEA